MDEDYDFNFKKFWGPDEYKSRVVFRRGSDMQCVYCGEHAQTREHCPPKVFLTKPYPLDLPVVPACERCNNGFSSDELYTKSFVEIYKQYCGAKSERILPSKKEVEDAKRKFKEYIDAGEFDFDERISKILTKLAVCHAVYSLTTGYQTESWAGSPEYISYTFRPNMTAEELGSWNDFVLMNNNILPIIGSRAFEKIYVIEPVLSSVEGAINGVMPFVVMDWSDIQEDRYRYVCWLDRRYLYIKVVISEFMYATVIFKSEDNLL